jgi:pimeloyl-ACP methyl ester carboxylesterase
VVIAHSLGGLLAQMLIGRESMRTLVLMGSLPPDGMMFTTPRLAATEPAIFVEAVTSILTDTKRPIALAGAHILFSEELPRDLVARYAARLQPEGPRAFLEAHAPGPILSALLFGIPTLVVAGGRDRIVSRAATLRTALYHGGEHRTRDELGHFQQLDPGAQDLAGDLLAWLDDQGV